MKKQLIFLSLILVLSLGAIKPLFHAGFFPMHDDTQVVRVSEMAQALKDGQFPVRWVKDLGYGFGYPIFNFYAPLAYYVGAILNLIGFNVLLSTKLMMGFGVVLAGISMYFLAKEFWGQWGGLVAGLFYLYAPYRAVDIYVRGAVGEFWAMAFLPLVFLGLYRIFKNNRTGILIGVLGFAGVILSHNLTAMMTVPFILLSILILFILSKTKKSFILYTLYFILLALGLSAFYWLPALTEMKFTKVFGQLGGGANFRDHFVFADQLWASPWGFGGSAPGRLDGMSFMVGKLHLLLVVLSFLTFSRISLLAISFLLLSIFFTIGCSRSIWEAIPVMAFIQYPWRFLALVTFFASFAIGSLGRWQKKSLVLVLILLVFNLKYFRPQFYLPLKTAGYLNEENIKWKTSKISDEYLPKDFPVPVSPEEVAWEKVVVLSGEAEVKDLKKKSLLTSFIAETKTPTEILLNTAYFPGWEISVNNRGIKPLIDSGRIKLNLPAGNYSVESRFKNTTVRTFANWLTLLSLFGFLLVLKYQHDRDRADSN